MLRLPLLTAALALYSLLSRVSPASAQVSAPHDQGVTEAPSSPSPELWQPPPSRWHDSWFVWEHDVTTASVGLGQDYQSDDPTYQMTFRLVPRYYLRDEPRWNLSVRGDLRVVHEVTNSDTTTRANDWDFVDTPIWLATGAILDPRIQHKTELVLRLPYVITPISRASWKGGHGPGVGAGLELLKRIPLLGKQSGFLLDTLFWPSLVYDYRFAGENVASNSAARRTRTDLGGKTYLNSQLDGSALPQHELVLSARLDTALTRNLTLITQVAARYSYRYPLKSASLCGVVSTGCVDLPVNKDAPNYGVSTTFLAEFWYEITPYFEVGGGYQNLSNQIGADGKRRNWLYSPDAQLSLSLLLVLDQAYVAVRGGKPVSHVARSVQPATIE